MSHLLPWEEVMSSMVLFDRYEVTPKSKAEALAADIRKSFEEGMADLENLLRERDQEIADLVQLVHVLSMKPRRVKGDPHERQQDDCLREGAPGL